MAEYKHFSLSLFALLCFSVSVFGLACSDKEEFGLKMGERSEITHPGKGHEAHISDASVAVTKDGRVLIAWVAQAGDTNNVYISGPGAKAEAFVRVNPDGLSVDSLHQSPGIAVGPRGEVYVSWSSKKSLPEGVLFASDLYISRSLDGGKSFDKYLRVNEDRPISHSFEGLDVSEDGTVLVSWIDSREGWDNPATFLSSISDFGNGMKTTVKLDDSTCVCCRVDVVAAPNNEAAVLWRKVFPGNIRDMVMTRFWGPSPAEPILVHEDGWQINACPHRGGSLAIDEKGKMYVSWYTEGTDGKPNLLLATSADGKQFSSPERVDESLASIPDHLRMAVTKSGEAVMVWEDSTAVRRRVFLRYTRDSGKRLSPIYDLSKAIKAYAPDIAVSPGGDFVVVWHEEEFPSTKTVIQDVRLGCK